MYNLRISGYIHPDKLDEFEQTAGSYFVKMRKQCKELTFSKDMIHTDLYHFHCSWLNKDSYDLFLSSEDYKIIGGSFRVLGNIISIKHGEEVEDNND